MKILPPLLAGILVSLSGCAASSRSAAVAPMTAEEVLRTIRLRDEGIRSIEAEGSLAIESPKISGTAGFELQLKAPDSLWVRFSGPFGISVGTLSLSKHRFAFYNPRENRLLTGSPDESTLERVFHVSLSFEDILNAVKGGVGGVTGGDDLHVSVVEGQYVLEEATSGGRRELRVDPGSFVTTRFAQFDETGRPVLTASASRIETVDGVAMPHLIRMILPRRRQSATIAYSTVEINGVLTKSFSLPDNVMELRIGKSSEDTNE